MKSTYGYSSYRGRSTGRRVLTALIVLLCLVLAAAIAGFFLLQGHIYYGEDGRAHVDLPGWGQSAQPTPTPADPVILVSPGPDETARPTPTPVQQQGALTLSAPLSGVWDSLEGEAVLALCDGCALFDMKGTDGMLGYVSDLPLAIAMGTSDATPGRNEALKSLNETQGLYTVARVSCFRDNRAPRWRNDMALRSYAGNWLDAGRVRWLNVAVPDTRDYLVGVCTELAALGFDEIWLDCAGYPTSGELENIKAGESYDPENLAAPVEAFYAAVSQALADYPEVKVGITASPAVLAGQADGSGQSLTALKTYADRLYVPLPQSEEEATACARAVEGMERPVCLGAADFLTEEEAQTMEDYGLAWGSLAETHAAETP